MPTNPQSGGESSTAEQKSGFVRGKRTEDTGEAERPVRLMDSLARLVHTRQGDPLEPVVTSVAFGHTKDGALKLVVGHNKSTDEQKQEDARRLGIVQQVLNGEMAAGVAASELAPTSGLLDPYDDEFLTPENRLGRDLRKLKEIYEGKAKDSDPKIQEQLEVMSTYLQTAFEKGTTVPVVDVSKTLAKKNGVLHAEAAVFNATKYDGVEVEMPIGVSKLLCGHCAEYLINKQGLEPLSGVRGAHGKEYSGTANPATFKKQFDVLFTGIKAPLRDQYADDSASSREHSDNESPSRPQSPTSVLPQRRASQDGSPAQQASSSVPQQPQHNPKREHSSSPPRTGSSQANKVERPSEKKVRR